MIGKLFYFLGGILVIVIVWYICTLVIGIINLPGPISSLAVIILGLLALVAVVYLAIRLFGGGPPLTPGGP